MSIRNNTGLFAGIEVCTDPLCATTIDLLTQCPAVREKHAWMLHAAPGDN